MFLVTGRSEEKTRVRDQPPEEPAEPGEWDFMIEAHCRWLFSERTRQRAGRSNVGAYLFLEPRGGPEGTVVPGLIVDIVTAAPPDSVQLQRLAYLFS